MRFSKFGLGAIVCISAALLAPATTLAGLKYSRPVVIGTSSASGSLGDTYNSTDTSQYIGCGSYGDIGYCVAGNSTTTVACTIFDLRYLAAARSLSGDSFVYFSWDASGICTLVEVDNYSAYAPKKP